MIKINRSVLIYAVLVMAFAYSFTNAQQSYQVNQVQLVTVPDFYGKHLKEALKMLSDSSFLVPGTITESKSAEPENIVIGQSPLKGSRVYPGSKVDLVISGPKVIVPNLVGLTPVAAISLLRPLDLHIHYADSVESQMEPGTIARQRPEAGSSTDKGTDVSIFIAIPILETVPLLIGRTLEEARKFLDKSRLRMGNVTSVESDGNFGKIINQSPPGGKRIKQWDPVDIEISVGPERVMVPDLTGLTPDKAERLLKEKRLILGNLTLTDRRGQSGKIVDQDPQRNALVSAGTAVNIFIQEQKYTIVLIPASSEVDSGETVEFRAEMNPPADNVEYQFHYGDGFMSSPTGNPGVDYMYNRTGTFTAYVTAAIDHRIVARSEVMEISVIPIDGPPLFWYLAGGGAIVLGGSGIGIQRYNKYKKMKKFLKSSIRQHKGTLTTSTDMQTPKISLSIKLRIAAEKEWISSIK